jgi:hypothetical protein
VTESTDHSGVTQFNLGARARIAGRDYYESRIPDSIKVYLATTPSERLDEEAIDNERLFYYRFAMNLPRSAREQVVAIKLRYGLTDAECRWLRRSGQFRVTRHSATLVRDPWVPAMGWFYAVIVMLFCGPSLMVIAWSGAPAWKQLLGLSLLAAFWLGSLWFINRVFLAPWLWLRKAGIESKGASPVPGQTP